MPWVRHCGHAHFGEDAELELGYCEQPLKLQPDGLAVRVSSTKSSRW